MNSDRSQLEAHYDNLISNFYHTGEKEKALAAAGATIRGIENEPAVLVLTSGNAINILQNAWNENGMVKRTTRIHLVDIEALIVEPGEDGTTVITIRSQKHPNHNLSYVIYEDPTNLAELLPPRHRQVRRIYYQRLAENLAKEIKSVEEEIQRLSVQDGEPGQQG